MRTMARVAALIALLPVIGSADLLGEDKDTIQLTFKASSSASFAATDYRHHVYYFPRAADPDGRQGFVRIINDSGRDGTVTVRARDDGGMLADPVTLELQGYEAVQINADDLENGNRDKGLVGRTGPPGTGDWRLEVTSSLRMEVLGFIRTRSDGFLTEMSEIVDGTAGRSNHVLVFNPGSNTNQVSLLRIVNPSDHEVGVRINGRDDAGNRGNSTVRLTLAPYQTLMVTAADLEDGNIGDSGSLGDGTGKWRLDVASDEPVAVMNLLATPTGHITNLSAEPPDRQSVEVPEPPATDDHGDGRATATLVSIPSETAGAIEQNGDRDWFRIEVASAMTLDVSTSGSMDSFGRLYDANGILLESDDDSGSSLNFQIVQQIESGTYYVEVSEFGDNYTGSYVLHVTDEQSGPTGPLEAPRVTTLGSDSFEIRWVWDVRPGESYAFDTRFRVSHQGQRSAWEDNCDVWDTPATISGRNDLWKRISNLVINGRPPPPGMVVEAQYRYRNGSSCVTGSPGEWSASGETAF